MKKRRNGTVRQNAVKWPQSWVSWGLHKYAEQHQVPLKRVVSTVAGQMKIDQSTVHRWIRQGRIGDGHLATQFSQITTAPLAGLLEKPPKNCGQ